MTAGTSGIYSITNSQNGKRYVGSAVDIKRRWREHRSDLRHNRHHNKYLQNSWNKHREDRFEFEVLEYWEPEFLISFEQWWMNVLKPEYNISSTAGSPLGYRHTEEAKTKQSKAQMGHAYNLGHKHTDEARANMSKAQSSRKYNPNSKLTAKQVRQIRKSYATGQHTQKALGNMFGVAPGHISNIINRKKWRHI